MKRRIKNLKTIRVKRQRLSRILFLLCISFLIIYAVSLQLKPKALGPDSTDFTVKNNELVNSYDGVEIKVSANSEILQSVVTKGKSKITTKLLNLPMENVSDSKATMLTRSKTVDAALFKSDKGVRIGYEVKKTGGLRSLKETIMLMDKTAQRSYDFELNLDGIDHYAQVKDQWRFYDKKGDTVFTVPAGYMVDNKGKRSEDVLVHIRKEKGKDILKVAADSKWLDSPERAWPVAVDPTIVVSGGITEAETSFGGLQRKVTQSGPSTVAPDNAITFVQSNSAQTVSSVTDVEVSFSSPPTSGNLVVVAASCWQGPIDAAGVTDNQGNTYTQIVSRQAVAGSNVYVSIFYAKNVSSSGTFTVTFNCDAGVGTADMSIAIHEYAGADTVNPLVTSNSASGTSTSGNSGNITTTIDDQLYFGATAWVSTTSVVSAGSGYGVRESEPDNDGTQGIYTEDKTGAAQTTSATVSYSSTTQWAVAIAVFSPPTTTTFSSYLWYATYSDGTDVYYTKSTESKGAVWGAGVDLDTTDADNYNPTLWRDDSLVYAAWIDDSTDNIQFRSINANSSDALSTLCTSADLGTIGSTFTVSIAVAADGTVYVATTDTAADTEFAIYRVAAGTCTFTSIATGSGLTAGDRPVLAMNGNTLYMVFQTGSTLVYSVYSGSSWTTSNSTIATNSDTTYSVVADGTSKVWVLSSNATTAASYYYFNGSSWSTQTTPWTGQTNLTTVSLSYYKGLIYAFSLHETSEQGYYKYTQGNSTSWSTESSLGFTPGDLGNLSSPYDQPPSDILGVVVRQGTNFEFAQVTGPIAGASVVVSGGITDGETEYGTLQRKIVYSDVAGAWYSFYEDGTDVLYKKSTDGSTWGSAVDIDTADATNVSPTVTTYGTYNYVAWADTSSNTVEINRFDTASSDTLGTKCTSAALPTLNANVQTSIAVDSSGLVYVSINDPTNVSTAYAIYKLTFSGCSFTDITGSTVAVNDTSTSAGSGSTAALAISHTVNSGTNYLIVSVSIRTTTETPTSVTWVVGATTQTETVAICSSELNPFTYMFAFENPTVGAGTATVNVASAAPMTGGAEGFSGVNLSSPYTGCTSNTGTSGITTNPVTSAVGDLVVDTIGNTSTSLPTVGGSQTLLHAKLSGSAGGGAIANSMSTRLATTTSTDMTWTPNTVWTWVGLALKSGTSDTSSGDPVVLVTKGTTLYGVFQSGSSLKYSVYDGSDWITSGAQIAAVSDTKFNVATDGTDIWVLTQTAANTGTNFYVCTACTSSPSWTTLTSPWISETNVLGVSLSVTNQGMLYAYIIKDASEQVYYKYSKKNPTSISWSTDASLGFTAGDLSQVSSTNYGRTGLVVRQGSNLEFISLEQARATLANQTTMLTSIGTNTDEFKDGKYMTAIVDGGLIYTSSDYGGTWTTQDSSRNWQAVAISSTGQYQTAIVDGGQIYTSSDYGDIWTAQDSARTWTDLAISGTGQYQTAVIQGGLIYTSSDYGDTWTTQDSARNWLTVSVSSTGKYQSATVYGGLIYTSSDYGDTWTTQDSARNWWPISVSSTGQYQTAGVEAGLIYTSSDYGDTWTSQDSARAWHGISLSSTGKYQTATIATGQIYVSSDYGDIWTAYGPNTSTWTGVSISGTGQYQAAVVMTGQIYISENYGSTWEAKESALLWRDISVNQQELNIFIRLQHIDVTDIGTSADTGSSATLFGRIGANTDNGQCTGTSRAWDVSSATYASLSKLVSGQDVTPIGVFFTPDGLTMYITGGATDTVYQYTLSTAWDVSTATYASLSKLVSGQDTTPRSVFFKPDGLTMYIMGDTNDTVYQYTLSTAWNVSTATYASLSKLVSGQDTEPFSVFFKPDGLTMYITGNITDTVYQYTLQDIISASCSNETVFGVVRGTSKRNFLAQFGGDGSESNPSTTGVIGISPGIHQYAGNYTLGDGSTTTRLLPSDGSLGTGLFLYLKGSLTITNNASIDLTGYGMRGGNGGTASYGDGGEGSGNNSSNGANGAGGGNAVLGSLGGAGGGGGGPGISGGAGGGGAGGNGGAGGIGANGGNGLATPAQNTSRLLSTKSISNLFVTSRGAGGGGGTRGGAGSGGGGGGGSLLWIRTHSFTNNGIISVNGGAGGLAGNISVVTATAGGNGYGGNGGLSANGGAGSANSTAGGGGGGGTGGGFLFIEADSITINSGGALKADGGNGGNGGNTTSTSVNFSGGAGANGFMFIEIVP